MKGSKKVSKKPTTTKKAPVDPKLKASQERIAKERKDYEESKKEPTKKKVPVDPKTYPPIVKLMDEGVQKEIDLETKVWNERLFTTEPYKGGPLDRFPLSPSQGGKCALALARNLAHYLGVADYPRDPSSISPRLQRIFARGHLLESALISDIGKFTEFTPVEQQRRVRLFSIGGGKRHIEGSIDSILLHEKDGVRILTDYKSKGAFHSAAFQDTISQFFQELRQTGLVEEIHPNCFLITDAFGLFNMISLDEFFVDYLIQLNSYAFAKTVDGDADLQVDFVSLYYENKNTCANYEVRWKPQPELFDFLKQKFTFIYDNVRLIAQERLEDGYDKRLEEVIPKEFSLGSARCKLCDYNEKCWGKYDPTLKPSGNVVIDLKPDLEILLQESLINEQTMVRVKEDVLNYMSKEDATHITVNGMCFERKYLKSPKPHYELRQCKEPSRSDR